MKKEQNAKSEPKKISAEEQALKKFGKLIKEALASEDTIVVKLL